MLEQHAKRLTDEPDLEPILRLENVVKTYGGFNALAGISTSIRRGTIHGLLGENGAGKSTLVSLISGQRAPTRGRILFEGQDIAGSDVKAMEARGVFLVTQEPMIVDQMSVAENLLLGFWPQRFGLVNWSKLREQARDMLDGTNLDADLPAGALNAVAKRKLNILRALFSGGKLIILDEPTTALNVEDRRQLFDFMRSLRAKGVTFIFISHYNEEILEICDAVTVLRDGRLSGESDRIAQMTSDDLSALVLGRDLDLFQRKARANTQAFSYVAENVSARGVNLTRFAIRKGEIVGFSGLPGSGAKEFAQALYGLNKAQAGALTDASGQRVPMPRDAIEALSRKIAYLSDDRRRDGLVATMSIGENISLSSLNSVANAGILDAGKERSLTARFFSAMGVKAASPAVSIDTLSGGNQQKVCLGRVLATAPQLLIVDEPTRGIDVGIKEEVHRILDALTENGMSVVVVTTDLDEMVRTVDRICIFANGDIVEELVGEAVNKETLRTAIFDRPRASSAA